MIFQGDYMQFRIPGIICASSGSLFCYCECRDTASDWAKIDLQIMKSVDDAQTWKIVKIFEGNGHTLNNPVMIEKNGVLYFLFCKNYKEIYYCKSSDDGETFGPAVKITDTIEGLPIHTVLALGPGHGIVTANGSLVIPMWFAYNTHDSRAHAPSFLGSLYSLDDGETWQCGDVIDIAYLKNPSECAMGWLSDNRILLSIRNENACRRRCFAISKTGYNGWENICLDERFLDPVCQGSMANGSGYLCHINCQDEKSRRNLVLRVTRDDFLSYKDITISEKAGYSDVCIKDSKAYILFEKTEIDLKMSLNLEIVDLNKEFSQTSL